MTRKEVKAILPILQAYAEGKTIQASPRGDGKNWMDVDENDTLSFSLFSYRIKPSTTYRPFANAEECWKEMLKHQPFGWVKGNNILAQIGEITRNGVHLICTAKGIGYDWETSFDLFTFADGSVFGVKVEE